MTDSVCVWPRHCRELRKTIQELRLTYTEMKKKSKSLSKSQRTHRLQQLLKRGVGGAVLLGVWFDVSCLLLFC